MHKRFLLETKPGLHKYFLLYLNQSLCFSVLHKLYICLIGNLNMGIVWVMLLVIGMGVMSNVNIVRRTITMVITIVC